MEKKSGLKEIIEGREYKYGFVTDIESEVIEKGLNENTIRTISGKKDEPPFMLEFRLNALKQWQSMSHPDWANLAIPPIDFQAISYYSAPKMKKRLSGLEEVPAEIRSTYEKLGIPIEEQKMLSNVAVDAVFDSISVATTHQKALAKKGIIFCSISDAIRNHPDLIKKYLGSVVPPGDNFYAALNSAVFSDGSFVYIPPNTKCPMELSTYFRINTQETGQFERTLIICDENSYVSYIEGCTAPAFDTRQLHAAIVELIALDNAEIKYSTVQNWFPGDPETGKGGILNFVVKRGHCRGKNSRISWTQIETGSAITWKYPGCVLIGDNSRGEFYSVALTTARQQADTGTKMIHLGKNTKSLIISKGISADYASNSYRGLVRINPGAQNARNYTQCDSLLVGDKCSAHTFPYIETGNRSSQVEHEASTSKISEDQLFYFQQRGIGREEAIKTIINGFCKDVFSHLPMEFAVEAKKLLAIRLENSIG
ncbi:MAG: Fe-S cluster assembly protein SufB [Nitrospinae bacterium]|nr:Fe-S cluster assembly protein SufB [Nitrospinota bacterium]MBI3813380.1 Fe-S cluster assembly protein SufB [Nitrospinota bacterium]